MAELSKLELLRAAREYAEDPEHIVSDPTEYIGEGAHGPCGCLLGIPAIVAQRERTVTWVGEDLTQIATDLGYYSDECEQDPRRDHWGVNAVVEDGQDAMLAVYDEAIRREEAEASA